MSSINPRRDTPAAEPDQLSGPAPALVVREPEHEVPVSEAVAPAPIDYVVYLCADDVWIELVSRSKN